VPALAEIQTVIRTALIHGDNAMAVRFLHGGAHPEHRLAVHQRHYATSLIRALVDRFPATVWLVGSDLVIHAAQSFIREYPPATPCIAEYGDTFPKHLGAQPGADALPYLTQFTDLEWHLGRLALATGESTNTHYVHLDWSLDELMAAYLADSAPEQFALRREEVWLEVRGVRGQLHMNRLTAADFAARPAGGHR
jgi:hypothetical protein